MVDGSPGLSRSTPSQARRIIQTLALLDLAITLPLAFPCTASRFANAIYQAGSLMGEGAAVPSMPPLGWFFVNLAGALGVTWAIVRLIAPVWLLVLADVLCRSVVAALISYYVLQRTVPQFLLLFAGTEFVGACLQMMQFLGRRAVATKNAVRPPEGCTSAPHDSGWLKHALLWVEA